MKWSDMGKKLDEKETGAPRRIYFDAKAASILDAHASALGERSRSFVVCALLHALGGLHPEAGEEVIFKHLKRVFGRDQFIAFLKSVAQVIPSEAKPIMKPDVKPEYQPDTWILGTTGILAFFNPNGENVGHVFSAASTLKAEHKLSEVLVVSPLADTMPESARNDLAGAKIEVVSIANLTAKLKKYARKKK